MHSQDIRILYNTCGTSKTKDKKKGLRVSDISKLSITTKYLCALEDHKSWATRNSLKSLNQTKRAFRVKGLCLLTLESNSNLSRRLYINSGRVSTLVLSTRPYNIYLNIYIYSTWSTGSGSTLNLNLISHLTHSIHTVSEFEL